MEKLRIMVVDDETELANYMGMILSEEFAAIAEIEVFCSGRKALNRLHEQTPDLLISDIRMPVVDGFQLVEYLSDQKCKTEVILLTAYKEFDLIYKANQKKVAYLVKTEKESNILKTVGLAIEKILKEREEERVLKETSRRVYELEALIPEQAHNRMENYKNSEVFWDEKSRLLREKVLYQIKEYVQQHAEGELNVNSLAEKFHYHPVYLSRMFKEQYHITLADFIMHCKMNQAKIMIQSSDMQIQEIAAKLGYQSAQAFIRTFKKETGLTPAEYRRIVKEQQ